MSDEQFHAIGTRVCVMTTYGGCRGKIGYVRGCRLRDGPGREPPPPKIREYLVTDTCVSTGAGDWWITADHDDLAVIEGPKQ